MRKLGSNLRTLTAACGCAGLIAVGACAGSSSDEGAGVTVTDSAGVQIVWSAAPVWAAGGGWRTTAEPLLEIGAAGDDPAYTLYQVGATLRLDDGRIVIANGGTGQLRFYDSNGLHLRDVGRTGDGPGEFRFLRDAWRSRGDSIMTSDTRLSRITIFDDQGVLGRTLAIGGAGRQVFGRRPFDDGTLLISGVVRPPGSPTQGLFDGGSRVFDRYTAEGELLHSIGEERSGANWGFTFRSGLVYTSAPFTVTSPPNASDGTSVYLGDGTGFEVEKRSAEGDLIASVRWAGPSRPVDAEAMEALRDFTLERATTPEQREMAEVSIEGLVFPAAMATYQALLVDTEGHLWVEQYQARWEDERRWWVFDPAGRWLGEPDVPTDLEIREIGRDYVLGVRQDEFGVEVVVMLELVRDG